MLRKRITFANVTSLLALFVALSAGSYAAISIPANSVGSKQIKASAVTAPKIKASAILGSKIKPSAIDGSKIKPSAIDASKIKPSAIDGSKIADGSLTSADLSPATLAKVPAAQVADSAPIAKIQIATADGSNAPAPASGVDIKGTTATCPTGMFVTGGGVHVSDSASQAVNDSHPAGNASWTGESYNAGGGTPSFTVYAVCATAATTG
jgi:hypothetical protein